MIERRETIDKFEEMYISKRGVSVLRICDFQGSIEDGF
jgi:hypothetical protein